MMPKKFQYTWTAPLLVEGQKIEFVDPHDNHRVGICLQVETHYAREGKSRHVYAIQPDGRKRWIWVGDESILAKRKGGTP